MVPSRTVLPWSRATIGIVRPQDHPNTSKIAENSEEAMPSDSWNSEGSANRSAGLPCRPAAICSPLASPPRSRGRVLAT